MNKTLVLVLVLTANGCAHHIRQAIDLREKDPAKCIAAGGTPAKACGRGFQVCLTKYSDVSRECTDVSQCQGGCELDWNKDYFGKKLPEVVKGVCIGSNDPCGCHAWVHNGKVDGNPVCAD